MDIRVVKIAGEEPEQTVIRCHEVTNEVQDIVSFVKSRQGQLSGSMEDRQYEIPVFNIYYIEAVDNHVFFYTKAKTYETRQKLFELEEALRDKHFLRVSKSIIVNLMKVKSIKPALNGRFIATLPSGEDIIISRKYVPALKLALKGGKTV